MADTTDYTGLLSAALPALATMGVANAYAGGQQGIANQLLAQGQTAANAAQFRPVGVTSRFGTSGFQYDQNGNLIGAGYQVAPDIAAMREGLLGYAGQNLANAGAAQGLQQQAVGGAQNLFNLGQQYVAQSPQEAAQQWMGNQQQLLAPGREQQLAQLQNQQFQLGRGGLAVGATNQGYTQGGQGLAATNPQMAAYYNAMAQQDAQLAAQAQQQGQAQTTFGQGLMSGGLGLANTGYGLTSAALQPYTTALTGATTTEALGQNALDVSSALGAKQSTAGASMASILNNAAQQAAAYNNAANVGTTSAATGAIKGLTDPVAQLIAGLTGASGASTAFGMDADLAKSLGLI